MGALISKAPSAAAERKKARLKRGDDGRDGDLVGLANSIVIDDQEAEEESTPTGLILDLTTHNHHHLGGATAAVAAAGGGAAAAAAAAVAAAAAAGGPPAAAGAVSVNAPSALAAGGPSVGAGGVGGLVGVPHHLGGLLGAAGVGAMAGPSGVGGSGGVDMVHDLILDGPGASGLCGVGAATASMIGGSGGGGGSSCIRSPSPTRLAYTSEKHPRSTFHELNMIRKHQDLCDVVINVGGSRKILAHKYAIHALHLQE